MSSPTEPGERPLFLATNLAGHHSPPPPLTLPALQLRGHLDLPSLFPLQLKTTERYESNLTAVSFSRPLRYPQYSFAPSPFFLRAHSRLDDTTPTSWDFFSLFFSVVGSNMERSVVFVLRRPRQYAGAQGATQTRRFSFFFFFFLGEPLARRRATAAPLFALHFSFFFCRDPR